MAAGFVTLGLAQPSDRVLGDSQQARRSYGGASRLERSARPGQTDRPVVSSWVVSPEKWQLRSLTSATTHRCIVFVGVTAAAQLP